MLIRAIINRLDDRQRQALGEVLRFGIVGVLATLIQAVVYWLLVGYVNYAVANTIGYVVSFVFNYIATTRFTFHVKSNARRGVGFILSHVVNYLLQTASLSFFIWLGLSERVALIPMFCVCVPVNFLLVRVVMKR